MNINEQRTQAHDLALIYIATAYGTDHLLSDDELATITELLQNWRDDFEVDEVQEVVMEAMQLYLEDEADVEVKATMERLHEMLSFDERQRALEDVVRIAEADGILLRSERGLITLLADLWEIKSTGDHLLAHSTAKNEERGDWSLMHDIALLYIVIAHSGDNELSKLEIAAMIDRLMEWTPEMSEDDIRDVLRDSVQYYGTTPDRAALQASVQALHHALPIVQRFALLTDLAYIAEADGSMSQFDAKIINALSKQWELDVRVEGHTD